MDHTDEAVEVELSGTLNRLALALAVKTNLSSDALYKLAVRKTDSQKRITKIVSEIKQFADDLGHNMERELEEVAL
jgi:hypothetical protein